MALRVEKRPPTAEETETIRNFTEDRSFSDNELTAEVWQKNNNTKVFFYYLTEDPEIESIRGAIVDLTKEFDTEDNEDDIIDELDTCYVLIGQNLH